MTHVCSKHKAQGNAVSTMRSVQWTVWEAVTEGDSSSESLRGMSYFSQALDDGKDSDRQLSERDKGIPDKDENESSHWGEKSTDFARA